ncbi:MAG: acetylglutamate kinase [Myxococcales bacterium]|nr:acetylglutamate kinase [Myxococcales bacterium]
MIAGRRVTDEPTLDVMKMVVAGKLNVDLCAALVAAGALPIGLHGASACVVRGQKRPAVVAGGGPEPIDFGLVGDAWSGCGEELVAPLLSGRLPPGHRVSRRDRRGQVFNINADIVANRVAVFLDAAALVLVSDVPGVLGDVERSDADPRITMAEKAALISGGTVTKGMIVKLEESFSALVAGVRRIHVVGRLAPTDLFREIETPGSVGTVLSEA